MIAKIRRQLLALYATLDRGEIMKRRIPKRLLVPAVFIGALALVVWWYRVLSSSEQKLVGVWQMTREYTTDEGVKGFTDHIYIFRANRQYEQWWIDRDSRACSSKVWRGTWKIRPGDPPLLQFRNDVPFLKRLIYGYNDGAAWLTSISDDEFIWKSDVHYEVFRRIESPPPEYPAGSQ